MPLFPIAPAGLAEVAAHEVLVGDGADGVAGVSGTTPGDVLTWNASGDPSFGTPTASDSSINRILGNRYF